jgi:hypothetical protein
MGIEKHFRIKSENTPKDFQRVEYSWLSKSKNTLDEVTPSKKIRKDSFS